MASMGFSDMPWVFSCDVFGLFQLLVTGDNSLGMLTGYTNSKIKVKKFRKAQIKLKAVIALCSRAS